MKFLRIARILSTCLLIVFIAGAFPTFPTHHVPATGSRLQISSTFQSSVPGLFDFIQTVKNEAPNMLVGVYIPRVLATPVLQQPIGNPNFVSTTQNVVTQFQTASLYGTTGLLAHDYLAGALFPQIAINNEVDLVYGDGSIKAYFVTDIQRYQALQPESPFSDFIDLRNPGVKLSAGDVFTRFYTKGDQVVLQTCIEKNGSWSWGRLFIIAMPTLVQSPTALPKVNVMPYNPYKYQ
jgi:hypothetical protein